MFPRSIRWRLQWWLAFLLVCILSGFGVTAYQLQRMNLFNQIDQELERRVAILSGEVRSPPPSGKPGSSSREDGHPPPRRPPPDSVMHRGGPEGPFESREIRLSAQTMSLFDDAGPNAFYFAIWSRGGNVLKRSTNAPAELSRPKRPGADTATHTRMREASREAFHFTEMGECILTGRSITADLVALRRSAWWLAAAGCAVLALGLGGGGWLASRALRPVQEISGTARRISAGNLSERISVSDTDNELGHLAGVLNSTFARLEAAFAQQKQFTVDASHELRTPIAVLITEAQTALARERSAAEYRETIEACLDTAQQMRRLSESLLELARFDAGQETIQRAAFDLAETTRACADRIRPLAKARGIEIRCDLAPSQVLGDAQRLGQVITNLLSNAIYYNRDHGEIRVETRAENGAAVITVADTGPGIAPEDLPHIFERFYRADKSRARGDGCSGLGLAICKAIVDAHAGSIRVATQSGAGTTFSVRLPT